MKISAKRVTQNELNLRNPLHAGNEGSEGIYPGLKTQGKRHQKSKTGVLAVPTKRTEVLQLFFLK